MLRILQANRSYICSIKRFFFFFYFDRYFFHLFSLSVSLTIINQTLQLHIKALVRRLVQALAFSLKSLSTFRASHSSCLHGSQRSHREKKTLPFSVLVSLLRKKNPFNRFQQTFLINDSNSRSSSLKRINSADVLLHNPSTYTSS